jgi:hypothetical protein
MLLFAIIMFYNDLWGFSVDPLILVITLQNRKTLFCVFLRFKDIPRLKLTWDFLGVNIIPREALGAQQITEGGHEAQKRPGGAGPSPGCATLSRLWLGPPMSTIFIS